MADGPGVRQTRPRARRGAVATCLMLVAAACAPSQPAPPATAPSHNPEGLYEALAPCADPPSPAAEDVPPGFVLPSEAVVVRTTDVGQLQQVEGFVGLTPLEVRDRYEQRDDVELLTIEDEGFETELLLRDDGYRMYLRAQVLCATGSTFTATVGAEADAPDIPRPAGTPSPP